MHATKPGNKETSLRKRIKHKKIKQRKRKKKKKNLSQFGWAYFKVGGIGGYKRKDLQ